MNIISIGLGNFVNADRIIAIVSPESAPVKRLIQESKDKGLVVDSTYGRRTRSVLVMDSSQVILSSSQPNTIIERNLNKKSKATDE